MPADDKPLNVLDTLLTPLRVPGRVVSDIQTLASAVVSLQADAKRHLSSIDGRAGDLLAGLRTLQRSINKLDGRGERLETIEETLTTRLGEVRADLNERCSPCSTSCTL